MECAGASKMPSGRCEVYQAPSNPSIRWDGNFDQIRITFENYRVSDLDYEGTPNLFALRDPQGRCVGIVIDGVLSLATQYHLIRNGVIYLADLLVCIKREYERKKYPEKYFNWMDMASRLIDDYHLYAVRVDPLTQ